LSYVGYIFFETAILGVSSLEGVVVVPWKHWVSWRL
jgi:hypothetical protein